MRASLFNRLLNVALGMALLILILGGSTLPPSNLVEQVRAFTRMHEFDYISWTLNALRVKVAQFALGAESYLPTETRHELVVDYLKLVMRIQQGESQLADLFADPAISDPQAVSQELRQELAELYQQRSQLAPFAEGILQSQVSQIATEMGLTLGGQPVPPVLYHSTPLPWALIVSPRQVIRQDADISLAPEMTVDEHVALEQDVEERLDMSSLVVAIGGMGLYPTMVQQTGDMNWLSEVVAHEWVHNFLTLRPLGISYLNSPELRTMNETAASIAGKEIGRAVIERYYPELLPAEAPAPPNQIEPAEPAEPPAFDFSKEMHETRVTVDRLLGEGKVNEAEAYMEMRRRVFWEKGYHIRKLNQAYFAFHGAYADEPGGGAAGEDPVGAAVRQLRQVSPSLSAFLRRISWMSSFEQLERHLQELSGQG